jgi:hypothetical protein
MNATNVYVPDYKKWEKYYDMVITQKKNEDSNTKEHDFPNNSVHVKNLVENEDNKNISLKLVSPVQMVTDQARVEVEKDTRKTPIKKRLLVKKRGKKQTEKRTKRKSKETVNKKYKRSGKKLAKSKKDIFGVY